MRKTAQSRRYKKLIVVRKDKMAKRKKKEKRKRDKNESTKSEKQCEITEYRQNEDEIPNLIADKLSKTC